MGAEAVGGPPLEAPVARNEKGRPGSGQMELAPSDRGTQAPAEQRNVGPKHRRRYCQARPERQAWPRVMDTLNMPPLSSQLTELPNPHKSGFPCPECGIYFDTRASLLGHMSKQHKDHAARPVNQLKREFDKHTDALGGLPRCSHCHVKLHDFSSLRKHINEHRCRVLFPTQPLAEAPAPPHPNPHETPSRDAQETTAALITHILAPIHRPPKGNL